jgi:serine protease AprX
MRVAHGVTWGGAGGGSGRSAGRVRLAVAVLAAAMAAALVLPMRTPAVAGQGEVGLIVAGGEAARAAVERLGGVVERELGILGGFSATVPVRAVPVLRTAPGVRGVVTDGALSLHTEEWKPDKDLGGLFLTTKTINAQDVWGRSDSRARRSRVAASASR